jgi:hypothetical protein
MNTLGAYMRAWNAWQAMAEGLDSIPTYEEWTIYYNDECIYSRGYRRVPDRWLIYPGCNITTARPCMYLMRSRKDTPNASPDMTDLQYILVMLIQFASDPLV